MDVRGISSAILRATASQTSKDKKLEAAKEKVKRQIEYALSVIENLTKKFPGIKCDARKIDGLKFLLEHIDKAKNIEELKAFQGCAKYKYRYLHEQLILQSKTASNELKDEILEDKEDVFGLGAFTSQRSLAEQDSALEWLSQVASYLKKSDPYRHKIIQVLKKVADEYGAGVKDLDNRILFSAVASLVALGETKPEYLVEFLLDRVDSIEEEETLHDAILSSALPFILNEIIKKNNFLNLQKHKESKEKLEKLYQVLKESDFGRRYAGGFIAAYREFLEKPEAVSEKKVKEIPPKKLAVLDRPRKITDISMVSSMADLLTLYGEKDKNRNGKLEVGELSEKAVKANDKTKDSALSPWEAMEAVNSSQSKPVFSKTTIELQWREGFFDTVYLKTDSFINGIKYKGGGKDWYLILDRKTGQVEQGPLAPGNKIYGIEFKAGTVLTLKKGRPVAVLLPENITVHNIEYKKGKNIIFHENGRIYSGYLAKNTTLKVGEQDITFSAGNRIYFDEKGRINKGMLANDAPLRVGKQNINFMAGSRISFNIQGKIWEGKLAKETTLQIGEQQISFKSGTRMTFWSNGQVGSGTLAKDLTIPVGKQKIILKQGQIIEFYRNGQIKYGISTKNTPVLIGKQKIIFKQGEELGFSENGQIIYGKLIKNTAIRVGKQRITFMKEGGLNFEENGQVGYGTLAKNTTLRVGKHKITFKKGELIRFYENGQIESGYLLKDTPIWVGKQKIILKQGCVIDFYLNGQVKFGYLAEDTIINGEKTEMGRPVVFPKEEAPADDNLELVPLAPTKEEPAVKPKLPPPDTSKNPEAGEDKLIEEMESHWKEGK